MLNGDKITNKDWEIGHMGRRALDLITMKGGTVKNPTIPVQRDWAVKSNGELEDFKWYFIRKEDREKVMKTIIDFIKPQN